MILSSGHDGSVEWIIIVPVQQRHCNQRSVRQDLVVWPRVICTAFDLWYFMHDLRTKYQ